MPSQRKSTQHADADVFTAIAHPVRRQILDILMQGDRTANQLAEPFDVTRSAISQHLTILLDSGLVNREKHGREQIYQLKPENLNQVYHWIKHFEAFWSQKLDLLGTVLDEIAKEEEQNE